MLAYFPLVKTKRPTGHFQLPVTCSEWKTYFSTHWNVKYYLFLLERQGWRFHSVLLGVQIRWDTCPAFQERNRTEILKASPIFVFHESSKPFPAIWASGPYFLGLPKMTSFFVHWCHAGLPFWDQNSAMLRLSVLHYLLELLKPCLFLSSNQ